MTEPCTHPTRVYQPVVDLQQDTPRQQWICNDCLAEGWKTIHHTSDIVMGFAQLKTRKWKRLREVAANVQKGEDEDA